jgi:CRP-like cAMP-binding protein
MTSQAAALRLYASRLASRSFLTEAEESAILGLTGSMKEVKGHADIVSYGDAVTHCCLVVEGCVGRFGQSRNGTRQITSLYIPGDIAGLQSIMSSSSGWGLAALKGATVLQIQHDSIRSIAAQHLGVAEALWRDCIVDESILSKWLVNVGHKEALPRVAHFLCEMAVRYEQINRGEKKSFPLPITQVDLGEANGLTSVHVNRMIRDLRLQSVARIHAGIVTIHDWDKLASIGEFDSTYMLLDGPAARLFHPVDSQLNT